MVMVLQEAQATTVRDQDDNKWVVYSKNNEVLGKLPARLSAQEAMDSLNFSRKYEHIAFNEGVEEGLARGKRASDLIIKGLHAQMNSLSDENLRLADILEQEINKEQ